MFGEPTVFASVKGTLFRSDCMCGGAQLDRRREFFCPKIAEAALVR